MNYWCRAQGVRILYKEVPLHVITQQWRFFWWILRASFSTSWTPEQLDEVGVTIRLTVSHKNDSFSTKLSGCWKQSPRAMKRHLHELEDDDCLRGGYKFAIVCHLPGDLCVTEAWQITGSRLVLCVSVTIVTLFANKIPLPNICLHSLWT